MSNYELPIKIQLEDSFFLPEEICGYNVTSKAKELRAVLLDLLVEFDRVCKKHRLLYSLNSGTLLGAVRHNGIIPWDNDIDVAMFREDYDKLCEIAPHEFASPYFFQTSYNDPGSARRHGQLRNSATTMILYSEMKDGRPMYDFNQGVFLDVFILDEIPDNNDDIIEQQETLCSILNTLWNLKQYYYLNGKSEWMKQAILEAHLQFDTIASKYNGTQQSRVANISLIPKRTKSHFINKELFLELIDHEFEGFVFPIPKESEKILTAWYGNWHEYVIGDDAHGNSLIDLHNSYTKYVSELSHVVFFEEKPHPLTELFAHHDLLLHQRDVAWRDIESYRELEKKLRENEEIQKKEILKYKKLYNLLLYVVFSMMTFIVISGYLLW